MTSTLSESGSSAGDGKSRAESDISGIGSMGDTDHVNQETFMQEGHESGTPAFAGSASETAWQNRLKEELQQPNPPDLSKRREHGSAVAPATGAGSANSRRQWNMEDMDTSIVGDQHDPLAMPTKEEADHLLTTYFSSLHMSFPILDEAQFIRQCSAFYSTRNPEHYRDRIFIALLKLVFAVGAVHSHLIEADWAGDERNHLLFFLHARVLAGDNGILNDACSLPQVQCFGLIAMYMLITDQINR